MCFSLAWLANLLIWLIVVCGVIALIRLLISFAVPHLGLGAEVVNFIVQALTIVLWVVVCCAAVWFIFELIECLLGGSLSIPRIR